MKRLSQMYGSASLIICLLLVGASWEGYSGSLPAETSSTGHRKSLRVVSYNVCWECMTHNDDGRFTGGTATELGAACEPEKSGSKVTACARNISDLFEGLFSGPAAGEAPSLISLQEATRWEELQKASPGSLLAMKTSHHRSGNAHLVTFFNENSLTLDMEIGGEFSKGRPFQILIFREGILYVNLHLGHHKKADYVSRLLSRGLRNAVPSPEERRRLSAYRIIMAGDFNDHSIPGVLTRLSPFEEAGISTLVSTGNTFNTCCDATPGEHLWQGTKSGDYVLDSEAPAKLGVPRGYNYRKLYSDHLPVLGTLKPLIPEISGHPVTTDQTGEMAVYLVPVLQTRTQLRNLSPGNSAFSASGGPHITLSRFVPVNECNISVLKSELGKINPREWRIGDIGKIRIQKENGLLVAAFESKLLIKGADALRSRGYKNIESRWQLTLGGENNLKKESLVKIKSLLAETEWEWAVAYKEAGGEVRQFPLWVRFE